MHLTKQVETFLVCIDENRTKLRPNFIDSKNLKIPNRRRRLSRSFLDRSVGLESVAGKKGSAWKVARSAGGTRTATREGNLFVPGERRPLSRRRSSLDESSSTRPTFAEPSLLFTRFFLEFFFPEPSKRKNKRENTLSSDKGTVSKTDLQCTQCAATHPLCVHCCNAACNSSYKRGTDV